MSIDVFIETYPNTQLVSNSTKNIVSQSCKESNCGSWIKGRKHTDEEKEHLSIRNSGEGNPFFGKTHDEETRQRMSDNHADFTGDNNPYKRALEEYPEKRVEASKRQQAIFAEIKADPQRYSTWIERNSKSVAQAHLDGKLLGYGRGHKNGHYFSIKFDRDFYYRSSYELRFIKYCENNDFILSLSSCDFSIPYKASDGYNKNYIPDFLVNDDFLIEIKPRKMLEIELNKLKLEAAADYCNSKKLKLIVLTEDELSELESNAQIKSNIFHIK